MPYRDDELLDAIRAVATEADSDGSPTIQEFRTHGSVAVTTVTRRFGSWQAAVEAAGFDSNSPTTAVSREELVTELVRVANELDTVPTAPEMNDRGAYSVSTYQRHFGSWADAITAVFDDADPNRPLSDETLVRELRRLNREYRSPPRVVDMATHGAHSPRTYITRFGSWTDALLAAGFDPEYRRNIPTEDLIGELYRLQERFDDQPTSTQMAEHGEYSVATYQRRFGSWSEALTTAFSE